MKRAGLHIFLIAVCMVAFESCYNDSEEELYPNSNQTDTSAAVTWTLTVKPIIDQKCATAGCHVSGAQSPDLSSYLGVFNNKDRVKIRATELDNMPAAGALSQANQDAIAKWINNGALNN